MLCLKLSSMYLYPHNEVEGVYWNHHGCLSIRLSVDTILCGAFLAELCFKLSSLYLYPQNKVEWVYWNRHGCPSVSGHNIMRSLSSTVLHVLLWNLYIMFVFICSCACAIFMTILSLVVKLSSLQHVHFTKSLLPRALVLHFCKYCYEFTHNVCVYLKLCICNFHDHIIIDYQIISPSPCEFDWIIVT